MGLAIGHSLHQTIGIECVDCRGVLILQFCMGSQILDKSEVCKVVPDGESP